MNFTHYIASVSFGKDSLAMLLLLIEKHISLSDFTIFKTDAQN